MNKLHAGVLAVNKFSVHQVLSQAPINELTELGIPPVIGLYAF